MAIFLARADRKIRSNFDKMFGAKWDITKHSKINSRKECLLRTSSVLNKIRAIINVADISE